MKKLALGTVQFGLPYGVSNSGGQTSEAEVEKILRHAERFPEMGLDTASAYGNAEQLLGRLVPPQSPLRLVTKISPAAEKAGVQIDQALRRLNRSSIYGVLAHHAADLLGANGEEFYRALLRAKQSGKVERIGCSVYSAEEALAVSSRFALDIVQLPCSPLDQRALPSLPRLRSKVGEIQVRSLFLQGALFLSPTTLPPDLRALGPAVTAFHAFSLRRGLSPVGAAFAFVRAIAEADVAVVGVNSLAHLQTMTAEFFNPGAAVALREFAPFAVNNPNLIDPSLWRKTA